MATYFQRFLHDESGLIITAELIMIMTIAVIGLTAGWGAVSTMLSNELGDVANSVGSLNQSFNYRGVSAPGHATCSGSGFNDNIRSVNISTSSNFNAQSSFPASVAGAGFAQQSLALAPAAIAAEPMVLIEEEFAEPLALVEETAVEPLALVEEEAVEPLALVEEEFGMNVQIDQTQLRQLETLGIITIREDGAVILLREDLIKIQDDGSIIILEEAGRREGFQQSGVQYDARLSDLEACRKELESLRKQMSVQSRTDADQLRQENARLRKLIDKLSKETKSR